MAVFRNILLLLFIISTPLLSTANAGTGEEVKSAEPPAVGTLTGKIESENKAMVFGYVGFFLTSGRMPDPTRFWRTPDYIAPLRENGEFEALAPEGKYYIIAIKKSKRGLGPPEAGDHFFYYMDVKGPRVIEVKRGVKLDIGINRTIPVTFVSEQEGITAIKGIILDEEGKPLSGVRVGAYSNFAMLGKPDYITRMSDKDGRYELRLPEGGSYYIVARSRPGGPPVSGDYYGRTGEENKPIAIKTGEILEMNITVYKLR